MPKPIIYPIGADSKKFRDELARADKAAAKFDKTIGSLGKVAQGAFVAMAGAVAASVREFSKFEKGFSNVVTLLDKSSFASGDLEKGIESLKNGVISLGAETGESFDNLNKGLFDLISAGVPAEKAIDSLRVATHLAAAGATDTAVAVDGLTSAMNAFGISADRSQSVAEKFFTAQKFGKTTIEELASNFGQVAATASAYGVSLDEVLASTAAATAGSIQTGQAMTSLKAAISNISKPTAEAVTEAKRLGIQFDAASLRSKGLKGFLDSVTTSAGYNADTMGKLFGSVEALSLVLSITGETAELFNSTLNELNDEQQSAATFAEALAAKQATADAAMNRLTGSVSAAMVVIGEQFAPAMIGLANVLTDVVKGITSMDDETRGSVSTVAKWSGIVVGAGTGVSLLTKAVAGARGAITVLNVALTAGRIKAIAFWGAMTAGISLVVGFLPEITDAFNKFFGNKSEKEKEALKESKETGEEEIEADAAKLAALEEQRAAAAAQEAARVQAQREEEKALKAQADEEAKRAEEAKLAEMQRIKAQFSMLTIEDLKATTAEEYAILKEQTEKLEALDKQDKAAALERQKEYNDARIQAHEQAGDTMAALDKIRYSMAYNTAKDASGELSKLVDSENKELREIGKAATLVQIGISTFDSATKAFNALAWIPVVGPGLGAAAAAAISLYGKEQAGKVQRLQSGGFVKGGADTGGMRDSVPAMLEGGELVLPRSVAQPLKRAGFTAREVFNMLGAGAFKDGGFVGAEQGEGMLKTFNTLFPLPRLFKDMIAGKMPSGRASGFGAGIFDGVVGGLVSNLADGVRYIEAKLREAAMEASGLGAVDRATGGAISGAIGAAGDVGGGIVRGVGDAAGGIGRTLGFQSGGFVPTQSLDLGGAIRDAMGDGAQEVRVSIGLRDDAATLLTAQQLEKSSLGIG